MDRLQATAWLPLSPGIWSQLEAEFCTRLGHGAAPYFPLTARDHHGVSRRLRSATLETWFSGSFLRLPKWICISHVADLVSQQKLHLICGSFALELQASAGHHFCLHPSPRAARKREVEVTGLDSNPSASRGRVWWGDLPGSVSWTKTWPRHTEQAVKMCS